MRIIAGQYRSIKLETLSGDTTRPTLDQVKESIFNHLGSYFTGGCVLDAFAGSGAIGFEFLSRGATEVDFVEKDKSAMRIIKQNYAKLKNPLGCNFYLMDSFEFVRNCNHKYDYVFIDPPYDKYDLGQYLDLLVSKLNVDGEVIIECLKTSQFSIPDDYMLVWEKDYRLNKCLILKLKK